MQGDQIAGNETGAIDQIANLSLRAGNRHGYGLIEAVLVKGPGPAGSTSGRRCQIDAQDTESSRRWHQGITGSRSRVDRPYVNVVSRHQPSPGLANSGHRLSRLRPEYELAAGPARNAQSKQTQNR